jgi:nucleolar complex protein 3
MKKLRELRTMLTTPEIKSSYLLQKLIIVSLCEIFKDIMPSYKIRAWTDKENSQNVWIKFELSILEKNLFAFKQYLI